VARFLTAPAQPAIGSCALFWLVAIGGCTEDSFAGPGAGLNVDGGDASTPSVYCRALSAGGISLGDTARLIGAPLAFAPTTNGFGLSVVLESGSPATVGLRVRAAGADSWSETSRPVVRATDLAEWRVDGLAAGARYEYEVVGCSVMGETALYVGSVVTQRPA